MGGKPGSSQFFSLIARKANVSPLNYNVSSKFLSKKKIATIFFIILAVRNLHCINIHVLYIYIHVYILLLSVWLLN